MQPGNSERVAGKEREKSKFVEQRFVLTNSLSFSLMLL